MNPVRMKTDHGRIIDVAASHYTQISAALTETSKVKIFVWHLRINGIILTIRDCKLHKSQQQSIEYVNAYSIELNDVLRASKMVDDTCGRKHNRRNILLN